MHHADRLTRPPKTAQALALRARLVLAAADGRSNKDVAAALLITEPTVGKWRRRFMSQRLDGLLDEPRPGAPRTIGDAEVERVIALTLELAPRDATQRSTRSMAAVTGSARARSAGSGRPFALAPQRSEMYRGRWQGEPLRPDEHVVCADEETSIGGSGEDPSRIGATAGRAGRVEHDYQRRGALAYLAAWDVHRAQVFGRAERTTGIVPFGRLSSSRS